MGQQATPKDAAITVNNTVPLVAYNGSFVDSSNTAATAMTVFTAAQNPNGAIVEFAQVALSASISSYYNIVTLLVKATPPTNANDGDAIMVATCQGGTGGGNYSQNLNIVLPVRVEVPAGKGLYINQQIGASAGDRCLKTILYTLK